MKLSDIRCSPQALGRRGLGLVLILSTAIIWVVASFISELLVSTKPGQRSFHVPPLLLTYLATAVFMMFLPIAFARMWWEGRTGGTSRSAVKYQRLDTVIRATSDPDDDAADTRAEQQQQTQQQQQQQQQGGAAASSSLGADLEEAMALAEQQASISDRQAAHREALTAAAQCFLLWFAAQYCFNLSLSWTSVTSNTILSSTSSLFTFALSMLFLKEPYSLAKLLSIGLCIGGTVLVTVSDKDASSSSSSSPAGDASLLGDLLCLVSALFYASYVVVMRRALPDDEEANVALFFGYVGLFSTLALGPVVGVMAWSGSWDLGAMPKETYGIIAVEGVLNYAFSDYLWAHAVLLLGPTIATLGLSVQIPIAAVAEVVWGHPRWLTSGATVGMTVAGTLLIMAGFFWGNLAGKGPVPGSHHRNGGDAEERRYLQVGADDWNAAFTSDDDDSAPLAIPVSTSASTRGHPSHPHNSRSAQPSSTAAGSGRQSASIEMSPTPGSGKGGAASVPTTPEKGAPVSPGGAGGTGGSSGSRSSSEGSPGSAGSRRPYKASRLARTTSYLDPLR